MRGYGAGDDECGNRRYGKSELIEEHIQHHDRQAVLAETLDELVCHWNSRCQPVLKLFSISAYPTSYFVACPERMRA
jgi:hypothetical protein